MFEPDSLLWCIPFLPLVGALLSALMGRSSLRRFSHWPCVVGAVGAFGVTLLLVLTLPSDTPSLRSSVRQWFAAGGLKVEAALVFDPLAAIMLVAITFVGAWIAIFSIGYMHGDEGYTRYFALVSLFLFAMTLLVLADNFLLLFAGWEGVGLCSYLLVGYWYAKPSAAAAARKAFLVTRLGDVGLILGLFILWTIGGHSLNFLAIFGNQSALKEHHDTLVVACLLILCGAIGKSAQFPLYVWLPDAMEGPTPISALIHAATMVTAGVYLIARCMPIFVLCPGVQLTVACVGAFTALIAAYIALTQHDLKRVLAYSTISQIGYMFLALGCAGPTLAIVAVTAAIFHLFTHAFFKAVLFLSAGSVMHGMGNVIDMRRFGGLHKVMPITHAAFLCGAAALAGLPFLSGFWSKDAILETVLDAGQSGHSGASMYIVLFIVALVTAALTAFYTFRAYFRTFWGTTKIPLETAAHAHESPLVMTVPLLVLGFGALFVGIVAEPFTHWFSDFLGRSPQLGAGGHGSEADHHFNWPLMLGSSAIAIAAALLAMWMYILKPGTAEAVAQRCRSWYGLSLNRLYVDEIYNLLFVQPLRAIAIICNAIEALVFDIVRLIAAIPRGVADAIRPLQNGLVQFYALTTAMGLAAFIGYLVFFAK
jgi:proton-translocating NADH-quinone oxidoreductase chain L